MKQIAVVVAAAFMLTLVAPAFAQPFADVPTNHWAYDAIAELAAKGLIEGYPDGTFKGDRAMTRYEMAMVVARLLARIESIQIPAPAAAPAPQVTRADLAALQRLINEFRAELAALGVRVTAIEEELNAIKARLDNVRVTGRFRVRYDGAPSATGASMNGNPNALGTDSGNSATLFRARAGFKLIFDGSVAPEISARLAIENTSTVSSTPFTFNSGNYGTLLAGSGTSTAVSNTASSPVYVFANISEMFITWSNAWGTGLNMYIGRMGFGQLSTGQHSLIFGPHGLLLNTTSDNYAAGTGGTHMIDGIHLTWGRAEWADLKIQGAIWRVQGSAGGTSYFLGEDAYGLEANIRLMPGLRIGGYLVGNTINPAQPLTAVNVGAPNSRYHVYGNPGTPGTNPVIGNCPAVTTNSIANGIACPAAGSGAGGYVEWDIFPGIHFDGEFAGWNDSVTPTNDSGYFANVTWDLGTLLGVGHKLSLQTSYIYAGANFYPPYANDIDDDIAGSVFPGNAQGFNGDLTFDITDAWGVSAAYFTGNNVSNGMNVVEYRFGVTYRFAPSAQLYTRIENQRINNVSQYTLYRTQLDYTF